MKQFDLSELYALFDRVNLPPDTREVILAAFHTPGRTLYSNRWRGSDTVPCPKTGMSVAVANSLERMAVYSYIFDDHVLGYLEGPFDLRLFYQRQGRQQALHTHRPAFLVFYEDRLCLEDWATQESLERYLRNQPKRYQRDEVEVISPPIKEAANLLKLEYKIRTDAEINLKAHRNREFLFTYILPGYSISAELEKNVRRFFKSNTFATLAELQDALHLNSQDDLFGAIANRKIIIDFEQAFVKSLEECIVFRDDVAIDCFQRLRSFSKIVREYPQWSPNLFESGKKISFDGVVYTILQNSGLNLWIQGDGRSNPVSLDLAFVENEYGKSIFPLGFDSEEFDPLILDSPLRYATREDYDSALAMMEKFRKWESSGNVDGSLVFSDRTFREYRKKFRDAESQGLDPLIAFLPRTYLRGNRKSRLPERVATDLTNYLEEKYKKRAGRSGWAVYGAFSSHIEKYGESVSKKTFYRYVKKFENVEVIRAREGAASAYQIKPFFWVMHRELPRHGDYPAHIIHIDHTELDVEVVSEEYGELLGRPWITLIICAFSRRIMGFYLSLRSPRYISCMAAILDMVRRRSRVPSICVYDGGSEFGSVDFEHLLRSFWTELKARPLSACRAGSVMERAFGTTTRDLIHNLLGTTKLRKRIGVRARDRDTSSPEKLTLAQLYRALEIYFFEIYDQRRHEALGVSPRVAYEKGLTSSGERLNRVKKLADCVPLAYPSVKGFSRTLDAQRGVTCNYGRYRNPRLEELKYNGMRVPVRADLLDPFVVYAQVNHEWYPMYLDGANMELSLSTRQAHAEEWKVLQCLVRDSQHDSNIKLADFLGEIDEEVLAREYFEEGDDEADVSTESDNSSDQDADAKQSFSNLFKKFTSEGFHGQQY
ncbi:integrase catalytic domain-containing protein [Paraburkholderia bannensis]|uniref:integrase catalytic domain-containing protein n=1 Tax=Paraburkholderia bannensis TaxID=765414 RepID=UPI002AC31939|nr:transposase family protein [Paraburkholderia bannensis]